MFRILAVFLIVTLLPTFTVGEKVYIGCYRKTTEKTFPATHSGDEFWVNCIKQCLRQASGYAGVNARECFCGDEIANTFVAVDGTNCERCFLEESRYCGGPDTLSLYKFVPPKASETAILLITGSGDLKKWMFDNIVLSNKIDLHQNITSFVYYSSQSDIFYVSGSKIYKIERDFYETEDFWHYGRDAVKTNCSHVDGLAIDWVNYTIYWGCRDTKSISWKHKGLNGYLSIHSGEIQSIEIEPYRKFLLYTNATGLAKYDIKTSRTAILKVHNFTRLLHTALDVQQERVYLIYSDEEGSEKYLVSIDYNSTTVKVVFNGEELSNPFGLDAVNGTVVWGNKKDNYTLYKAQVFSYRIVNVKILFTQSEKINYFKMDTYEARMPSTNFMCEKKNCSHMCVRLSATKVGCRCTGSLDLAQDRRTCVERLPTVVTSSQRTSIFSEESANAEDHRGATDYSTAHPTNVTMEIMLKRLQRFVYSFAVLSLITLVLLFIFIIYLAVKMQRMKRRFNVQIEIAELK